MDELLGGIVALIPYVGLLEGHFACNNLLPIITVLWWYHQKEIFGLRQTKKRPVKQSSSSIRQSFNGLFFPDNLGKPALESLNQSGL